MSSFTFAARRPPRRPSLTPMIDVVFLLLVFFMLAARFGTEQALPIAVPQASLAADWSGPPRLVTLAEEGLRLNGVPIEADALPGALAPLMAAPSDPVLLKPMGAADMQRLIDLLERLDAAGLTGLMIVE